MPNDLPTTQPRSPTGDDGTDPNRTRANTPNDYREPDRRADAVPAVPGYEVYERVGRGGFAVVYRAQAEKLGRVVALKVIVGCDHLDARAVTRFRAEAQAVRTIEHANVVEVLDYGEHDGRPYMALEFCPGGTLAARLRPAGDPPEPVRLAPLAAAGLVGKIAAGVAAAHRAGIVHRDLKPGNVLFDAAGEPKVADFGIAKVAAGAELTPTVAVMGTLHYMSIEQADGATKFVLPSADVWALGVILYELVAGVRPFQADTATGVLARVLSASPPPLRTAAPGCPPALDAICGKCLRKAPADRYPTARELADDLGRFARGEATRAGPGGRGGARWWPGGWRPW